MASATDDPKAGQWVTINGARILLGSPAHKALLRQIQQRRQAVKDTARGMEAARYMVQGAMIVLQEVSPPGWSGTTKAMKRHKGISNPFALAWWMKSRGAEPHKAPEKKSEAVAYAAELLDEAARLVEAAEDEAFTDQDVRQEWSRSHPNTAASVGEPTDTGGWVQAVLVGQSAVIVDRRGKTFRIPFRIEDEKVVFDDSAATEVRHKDVWEPVKEAAAVQEVTPPGFEPVVKALKRKKGITNPWAVAWSMKSKGVQPKEALAVVEAMEEPVPPVSPKRRASVLARMGLLRAKALGTGPTNLQPAPEPFPSKEAAQSLLDELDTLIEALNADEAGTSQGAKKGWASRRGGQRFEPKPGGGVRKSKAKQWTPEMVAQQRRIQRDIFHIGTPKPSSAELAKQRMALIRGAHKSRHSIRADKGRTDSASTKGGSQWFRHFQTEAVQPVRATLVVREAVSMSALPQLGRAATRVPGRPGSGIVRHDDGSLGRVPVPKASFHDDLRRKRSLRRVMHPAPHKVGAA